MQEALDWLHRGWEAEAGVSVGEVASHSLLPSVLVSFTFFNPHLGLHLLMRERERYQDQLPPIHTLTGTKPATKSVP